MNALAIVSDSGTLPEESSFYLSIGHPIAAVCIRTSTERPEALEAGDFILAGITTRELINATDMAIEMKQKGVLGKPCPDYVDETVSMKVVRIIQGYVNVVNKMAWRKYWFFTAAMHQHDRAAQIYYLRGGRQASDFPAKAYTIHVKNTK